MVLQIDAAHARQRRHPLVHQQAVDVRLLEARVVDRQTDRFGGEPAAAVAVDAAHLGEAEAGDDRLTLEIAPVDSLAPCV